MSRISNTWPLSLLLSLVVLVYAINYRHSHGSGLATPKIDTHSHVYPDFYRQAVIAAGWTPGPDGNPAPPVWPSSLSLILLTLTELDRRGTSQLDGSQ